MSTLTLLHKQTNYFVMGGCRRYTGGTTSGLAVASFYLGIVEDHIRPLCPYLRYRLVGNT